jgi:hypothetical protein
MALVTELALRTEKNAYLATAAQLHIRYREPIPEAEWATAIRDHWQRYINFTPKPEAWHMLREMAELGVLPPQMTFLLPAEKQLRLEDYDAVRRRLNPLNAKSMDRGFQEYSHGVRPRVSSQELAYMMIGASFSALLPLEHIDNLT